MIGIYALLGIGAGVFLIINVLLYTYGFLQASFILTIILEIIAIWFCFGPTLILYYMFNLKTSIEEYAYLYEQYEETQKTIKNLEKQSIRDKRQNIQNSQGPLIMIENQKKQIENLTKQNMELTKKLNESNSSNKHTKNLEIENEELRIENIKLKKIISFYKE